MPDITLTATTPNWLRLVEAIAGFGFGRLAGETDPEYAERWFITIAIDRVHQHEREAAGLAASAAVAKDTGLIT